MDEVADDSNGYEHHLVFVNTVKCYSINLIYPSIKKNITLMTDKILNLSCCCNLALWSWFNMNTLSRVGLTKPVIDAQRAMLVVHRLQIYFAH